MDRLIYQPFLTFSLAFTVSSLLFPPLSAEIKLLVIFISVILILTSLFFIGFRYGIYKKYSFAVIIMAAGIAFSSVIQYCYFNKQVPKIIGYSESGTVHITATIEKVITKSDYASYYQINVSSINGNKASFRANLEFQREFDADIYDVISFDGAFYTIPDDDNGFPANKYYSSKGIYLNAVSDDTSATVTGKEHSIYSYFANLSDKISAKLSFSLGDEYGSLVSGLLLGRRSDIPDSTTRDFKKLGLSHILAVSGLHLTAIVGGFLVILRFMNLSRLTRFLLCSILILFMMFLTGFSLTVVRAGIMMFFMLLARLVKASGDSLHALFLSTATILAFSPEAFSDIGFLMSFFSTFGLLTFGKNAVCMLYKPNVLPKPISKIRIKLLSSLISSVTAIIFTLPISCFYFKEISLFSPISNLIFIPLCSLLLSFSAFSIIFSSGFGRGLFCGLTKSLSSIIVDLADYMARKISEPISLDFNFVKYTFIAAALSFLLIFFIKKRKSVIIFISFSVWLVSFFSFYSFHLLSSKNEMNLIAANYGKNDFLLINQEAKTVICDFSDGTYSNMKNAASLAKTALHDVSVDVLFLTHLHRYHISSFNKLADSTFLKCLVIPEPYDEQSSEIYLSLTESAKSKHISVLTYSFSETASVNFFGCNIKPSEISFITRSVQPVFYLTVEYGSESFTYCASSLLESELYPDCVNTISSSDYIWLGIHGPNIKQPLPNILTSNNHVVVSQNINELYLTSYETINTFKNFRLINES